MGIKLGDIIGGIPIVGDVYNAMTAREDNEQARQDQLRLNQENREWELKMWNLKNAYDNPARQMERLRAAGLNPNLVYGNGADVTSGNINAPAGQKIPDRMTGQIRQGMLESIYGFGMKEMQKDLMAIEVASKTQGIAESQIRGTKMQGVDTNKVIADTYGEYQKIAQSKLAMRGMGIDQERDAFELGKAKELRQNSMDVANESLRNIQLRNVEQELRNSFLNQNQQLKVMEAWSRMKLAESTMNTQEVQRQLEKERLQLRQQGIEVNDNVFMRIFSQFMSAPTNQTADSRMGLGNRLKGFFTNKQ